MSKITIDLELIKSALTEIGYEISDFIERENNGNNWQIKFNNSGAIVTIYDTNTKKNTVVNGKPEEGEKDELKKIVDGLKCKELSIDPLNSSIVSLINSKKEDSFYDFKQQWSSEKKECDLIHDILCLANNIEHKESYLIIGVTDSFDVIGVKEWRKSNEIYDFLRSKKFAGGNIPEIELKRILYKYHKIDVLVIKQSENVPFFLAEKYKEVGTNIYTRIGDTNTPKNENASFNDIEKLWRIHFGLSND